MSSLFHSIDPFNATLLELLEENPVIYQPKFHHVINQDLSKKKNEKVISKMSKNSLVDEITLFMNPPEIPSLSDWNNDNRDNNLLNKEKEINAWEEDKNEIKKSLEIKSAVTGQVFIKPIQSVSPNKKVMRSARKLINRNEILSASIENLNKETIGQKELHKKPLETIHNEALSEESRIIVMKRQEESISKHLSRNKNIKGILKKPKASVNSQLNCNKENTVTSDKLLVSCSIYNSKAENVSEIELISSIKTNELDTTNVDSSIQRPNFPFVKCKTVRRFIISEIANKLKKVGSEYDSEIFCLKERLMAPIPLTNFGQKLAAVLKEKVLAKLILLSWRKVTQISKSRRQYLNEYNKPSGFVAKIKLGLAWKYWFEYHAMQRSVLGKVESSYKGKINLFRSSYLKVWKKNCSQYLNLKFISNKV